MLLLLAAGVYALHRWLAKRGKCFGDLFKPALIGDRFDYVIDVEKDLVQVVDFPVFEPREGEIELVASSPLAPPTRDWL